MGILVDSGSHSSQEVPNRTNFHREMERLESELLLMGGMVGKSTLRAVEALRTRDLETARAIEADDILINRRRFEIEESVLLLIATQQPMATDLRTLAAILNIVTDLERMGDYAAGIARICLEIGDEPLIKPLIDLPRMADRATDMLRRALDAFVKRDMEAANLIALEDDAVDGLYQQVYRELLVLMIANPKVINQATHLLWVAHNLERVADRVQNICERIVFVVTGVMREYTQPGRRSQ